MSTDKTIIRAAIHPAIGIARVGNSNNEYFIGPEVPYPTSDPSGGYKDPFGAIKRQAARFRIYGYNKDNDVVAELNSENADIEWIVHVANKKAAWYQFTIALDIPEAVNFSNTLRNKDVRGDERKSLIIDPGPLSIHGINHSGPKFDKGNFQGASVYLGELRTDDKGNLIFLGGRGVSGSPKGKDLTTFANNDGWFDDISDGPVNARVTIEGKEIPVEAAWVVVGPPNYAPDIVSVQTMYDLIHEASESPGVLYHTKPSFMRHILPLLRQFADTSWVNFGFHIQFGWGAPYDFLNAEFVKKLATYREDKKEDAPYQELRRQISNMFRSQDDGTLQTSTWPQIYGDAYGDVDTSPRARLGVTRTLYRYLQRWVEGDFYSDYDPEERFPKKIEEVSLPDRPHTLDRAALHFCMGGPFHPGCEMTWPMRHSSMYGGPYRIHRRKINGNKSLADEEMELQRRYGPILKPVIALNPGGPLYASSPGDITKWMAVPWQADTASCRSGYEAEYDPYLPTFWPSRVPNHVLDKEEYEKVIDAQLTIEDRLEAFNTRTMWLRWLKGNYINQITQMVKDFGKFGIIVRKKGIDNDAHFPSTIYVESDVSFENEQAERSRNLTFQEGRTVRFVMPRQRNEFEQTTL
jgi:hypothetical protein